MSPFPPSRPLRLLLVDDHALFRAGLRAVLSLRADFVVVAEADTVAAAVAAWHAHRPDVVLMDLRLPDGTGIAATAAIRQADPAARVLLLTTYDGDEDIHRALAAGACGYLLKNITGPELLEAVAAAAAGRDYVPPAVRRRLAERAAYGELTPRELETLELVVKGLTNREIAAVLRVTEFTAKAHVRNLLAKLGAADRTEAATLALQRGLVHLP